MNMLRHIHIFRYLDTLLNYFYKGSDFKMANDIRVLSLDTSQPLTFAKISEFDPANTVNTTDYLLVSGFRDGEEITQRIKIADIAKFFNEEIAAKEAKWFIPVVNTDTSTIHWELHYITEVGTTEGDTSAPNPIYPIVITDLIGDVTDTKSGLLPPAYKAKLDALDLVTETSDGLMAKEDKVKLNGIEDNANNYVLPKASTTELGGVKVDGVTIVIDNDGVIKSNAGVPFAYDITLNASDWNAQTHMLKVNIPIDTANRNTVDVVPSSMDEWINCKVHAIQEDSTGITFACQSIPEHDLDASVVSMLVIHQS